MIFSYTDKICIFITPVNATGGGESELPVGMPGWVSPWMETASQDGSGEYV
jgi:hypothetical protein